MSSPIDYPILVSQLPFVSKLATAEQTHPEARQEQFASLLEQKQREERRRVQEVEKKEKAATVTRDGGSNQGGAQQHARGEQRQDKEEPPLASNASPWSGNIVNKRV
ncbi:MAG: hypothetical protein PHX58_05565 [Desulfovibrio sp.]|jgi:hypothetical protein|nr:hypothetical protein [Desulfovibrio sp.]